MIARVLSKDCPQVANFPSRVAREAPNDLMASILFLNSSAAAAAASISSFKFLLTAADCLSRFSNSDNLLSPLSFSAFL